MKLKNIYQKYPSADEIIGERRWGSVGQSCTLLQGFFGTKELKMGGWLYYLFQCFVWTFKASNQALISQKQHDLTISFGNCTNFSSSANFIFIFYYY